MLVFLLSLLACETPEGASPALDRHPHPDHDHHDHLPDLPGGRVCGDHAPADLESAWCVRLAPGHTLSEPADTPDPPLSGGGPGESQTRCADINMLQSVALVGTPDDPVLAWCDPNLRGGPRLARWDEHTGQIESAVFVDESCVPASHAIGLLPLEEGGWSASWLGRDHRDALVRTMRLDAAGEAGSVPETVRGTWGARAVVPVDTGEALLTLSGGQLSYERVIDGEVDEARLLGEGVDAWGAARDDDAVWVGVCSRGRVRLERVDPHTLAPEPMGEVEAACGIGERVHVATGPGGVAVTWFGLEGGWLWLRDDRGTVTVAHLGEHATAPTVTAWDDGWLTVDGSGFVRLWGDDGSEREAFTHPHLVGRAARGGEVAALYPLVDAFGLVLAVVGQESLWMDPHIYNYQTLELSRVDLP